MPRTLFEWDVSRILAARLRLLYDLLEDYERSRLKPPRNHLREIAALEARIYEESYAAAICGDG